MEAGEGSDGETEGGNGVFVDGGWNDRGRMMEARGWRVESGMAEGWRMVCSHVDDVDGSDDRGRGSQLK